MAANARRVPSQRRDEAKVVVSVSDPDAALGLDKEKVFRPLYNVQTVRDVESAFVLGYGVFTQTHDAGLLEPMLERTALLTGRPLRELLVDSGYVTGSNLALCDDVEAELYGPWKENDYSGPNKPVLFGKERFVYLAEEDAYRCPARQVLPFTDRETRRRSGEREEHFKRYRGDAATCGACPRREQCTKSRKGGRTLRRSEHEELMEAHGQKMATESAQARYRLRAQSVELVFADLKEHRGLRRFSSHGLDRVQGEVALEVLVHNLLQLHRCQTSEPQVTAKDVTTEKNRGQNRITLTT